MAESLAIKGFDISFIPISHFFYNIYKENKKNILNKKGHFSHFFEKTGNFLFGEIFRRERSYLC